MHQRSQPSNKEQLEFTRDLALGFAKDLRPLPDVEREGFADFAVKHIPGFGETLPSRRGVSTRQSKEVYQEFKQTSCQLLELFPIWLEFPLLTVGQTSIKEVLALPILTII